jgi:hypothetical protein
MKRIPPRHPVVKARVEPQNPLWMITVALAVFAAFAAAAIAWG